MPGSSIVRPAVARDYEDLSRLHRTGFASGWSAGAIKNLASGAGVATRVLAGPGAPQIYGFSMVRSVAGEGEILTITIAPVHRRQGYGGQLMAATLGWLEKTAVDAIFLEVACGNEAAIALYRRFGFRDIGRRKGYTTGRNGGREDALRMVLDPDWNPPDVLRAQAAIGQQG